MIAQVLEEVHWVRNKGIRQKERETNKYAGISGRETMSCCNLQ
jgi:hypothetical protein